jgi:GntR family transcriptional regulator, transcriptional repressor for pyruvate dehydrogenase complex
MTAFPKVPRLHAADHVFEELARRIVRGELAEGAALPPERILAEEFGVSRIIARQAVHRLSDMGLLEVRQGGKTIIRPFAEITDVRALVLLYRFCPDDPALAAEIFEKQYLQGLALVERAGRLVTRQDHRAIRTAAESDAELPAVEEAFWRALATLGRNRVLRIETAWWYANMPRRARAPEEEAPVRAFYIELGRRLVHADDPVGYYRLALAPALTLAGLGKPLRPKRQ